MKQRSTSWNTTTTITDTARTAARHQGTCENYQYNKQSIHPESELATIQQTPYPRTASTSARASHQRHPYPPTTHTVIESNGVCQWQI